MKLIVCPCQGTGVTIKKECSRVKGRIVGIGSAQNHM